MQNKMVWTTIYKIVLCLVVLFIVLNIYTQSKCELNNTRSNEQQRELPVLVDEGQLGPANVVPYTATSSSVNYDHENIVYDQKTETVLGLKEAGYSLNEIVSILKNDGQTAVEISIVCLNNGYNGASVFNALKDNGFSGAESEMAVPPALMAESLAVGGYAASPDFISAGGVIIKTNPFLSGIDTYTQQDNINPGTTQQNNAQIDDSVNPINVEVSIGVSFNGLGDWNRFQNQRYESNGR